MKRLSLLTAALLIAVTPYSPSGLFAEDAKREIDPGWLNDLQEALKQSRETGRPILAEFTGSDWCGWCKKMDAEVFGTARFRNWAKENVILLEVDFPKRKNQTPRQKEQNHNLQNKFRISGYPTVVFMANDQKELGRIASYKSLEKFIDKAEDILEKD